VPFMVVEPDTLGGKESQPQSLLAKKVNGHFWPGEELSASSFGAALKTPDLTNDFLLGSA